MFEDRLADVHLEAACDFLRWFVLISIAVPYIRRLSCRFVMEVIIGSMLATVEQLANAFSTSSTVRPNRRVAFAVESGRQLYLIYNLVLVLR